MISDGDVEVHASDEIIIISYPYHVKLMFLIIKIRVIIRPGSRRLVTPVGYWFFSLSSAKVAPRPAVPTACSCRQRIENKKKWLRRCVWVRSDAVTPPLDRHYLMSVLKHTEFWYKFIYINFFWFL